MKYHNSNNTQDKMYGAVIITNSLQDFNHSLYECRTEPRRCRPSNQATWLGPRVLHFALLSSTPTIDIRYYSAVRLILVYHSTEGRRPSQPGTSAGMCSTGHVAVFVIEHKPPTMALSSLISYAAVRPDTTRLLWPVLYVSLPLQQEPSSAEAGVYVGFCFQNFSIKIWAA